MHLPTDLKNLLVAYERRIIALEERLAELEEKSKPAPKKKVDK